METKDHDEHSDSESEGGGVQLSEETLRALREFALDSGVYVDSNKIIESVRDHFEEKDREDVFKISYASKDGERKVDFNLKGIKRELGQTLDSTGLTMYELLKTPLLYTRYVHHVNIIAAKFMFMFFMQMASCGALMSVHYGQSRRLQRQNYLRTGCWIGPGGSTAREARIHQPFLLGHYRRRRADHGAFDRQQGGQRMLL